MKRIKLVAISLALFAVGVFIGTSISRCKNQTPTIEDKWMYDNNLSLKGDSTALSFTTDAIINPEIELPEIDSIHLKCKFISQAEDQFYYSVAYVMQMSIKPLNKKDIPKK